MYLSRVCGYGLFVVAWLCCSSLLIDAQNLLTNPEEGEFALLCRSFSFYDSQASFAIKFLRACLFSLKFYSYIL